MSQKVEHPVAEIRFYKKHIITQVRNLRLSYRTVGVIIVTAIFPLAYLFGYGPDQIASFFTILANILQP